MLWSSDKLINFVKLSFVSFFPPCKIKLILLSSFKSVSLSPLHLSIIKFVSKFEIAILFSLKKLKAILTRVWSLSG